ncbi:MAG: bile acid:sodium symporter family protein [Chitinophagales bacterium]|nr:bile acid:sodium symporter family protein [Chitinophagales bacterium]MDW8419740.1 bile acid:sodium symporter family protein [Chitinophagales bacterium]
MSSTDITTKFLPVALGIVMLGLGLSLTLDDFKRVVQYPKAVITGLICQMLVLPAVCFLLCKGMGLAPVLAVGLMLLSASPGGATANLYSHLSRGDVALNITLTAVNSLLTIFTIPVIVNLSLAHFMGTEQYIPLQFKKVLEVFAIVLVPVSIGMMINKRFPEFAKKMEKPVKIASALVLLLVIAGAVLKEKENIKSYFAQVGMAALLFNLLSLGVGYFAPKLLRLPERQNIAIAMEIGIHNGTLAIYIAMNALQNSAMAIPPAVYSLIMFFTAALFGWLINLGRKE